MGLTEVFIGYLMGLIMAFTNPKLNRGRPGWDRGQQISERTDPDYADKAEQQFLKDLLTLTLAEQKIALEGYSRKRREELRERLAQMRGKV